MDLDSIIIQYNNKLTNKYDMFDLLYQLKYNVEFNSSLSPAKLYELVSDVYCDNSPLYQNGDYSSLENLSDFIKDYIEIHDLKEDKHCINIYHNNRKLVESYENDSNILINFFEIITDDISDLKERVNDILKDENENNIHMILPLTDVKYSKQEIYHLFTNKIIPKNVVLPMEYVHKAYISDYFYNADKEQYYKIKEFNSGIVVCDIQKEEIYTKSYINAIHLLNNSNTAIISKDVYIHNFNELIKKMNQ